MKRARFVPFRSAHAIACLACALGLMACRTPPEPRDSIRFRHGPHLAEGITCARCHGAAFGAAEDDDDDVVPSTSYPAAASRPLLPAEADCRSCHTDPTRDRCERCHTEPRRAATYAPSDRGLVFDHARHTREQPGMCVRCHGAAADRTLAAYEPRQPPMATCTSSCHRDDMRALTCARCHTDLHRYRIDDVAMLSHGPGFVRRHGVQATADGALCTQCHEPTFCEDCHMSAQGPPLEMFEPTAVYRDFVHRGDFLARHGIEVGLERGTCVRCHGVSYCDGCHQASGVGGSVAAGSPHPPGWLDPLSAFGHARAARRDMLSCVSCHEQDAERTCVPCHRVGGAAGNPHPPGFGAGMDPLRHAVCRACHAP